MRRLLLLAGSVVFLDTAFFAAIVPLLPSYAHDLHLSKSAAGLLSGAYAAGTLLGSLPGGWLAGRAGARRTVYAGLALIGTASLVFGFAHELLLLDAARFVQGVGGAFAWSGAMAWLLEAAPRERRGELIGAALSAAIGGFLVGPALGAAAAAIGTRPVFGVVPVLAGALAAWAALLPDSPPPRPQPLSAPLRLGLAAAAPLTLVLAGPDQALVLAVVVVAADAALAVVCAPAITLLSAASEGAGLGQGAAFALVNLAWAGGQVVGAASAGGLAAATADVVPYALLASLCLVTLTGTLVRVRATTQV